MFDVQLLVNLEIKVHYPFTVQLTIFEQLLCLKTLPQQVTSSMLTLDTNISINVSNDGVINIIFVKS